MLNTLASIAAHGHDKLAMLDLIQQGLEIARQTGDRINEGRGLVNLGGSRLALGALTEARHDLQAALQLLRANGDRIMEAAALLQLATLTQLQGDAATALTLAREALDHAAATQARDFEAAALLVLGEAELDMGQVAAARQAFLQAQALALAIDSPWHLDARACLAQTALAEGDGPAALAALQPVLDHIQAEGSLAGTADARLIELRCHQTLARAGDPRADAWLARAHTAVMAQADAIADATLRRGFLHNIPHHQEIVVAWAQRHPAGG